MSVDVPLLPVKFNTNSVSLSRETGLIENQDVRTSPGKTKISNWPDKGGFRF